MKKILFLSFVVLLVNFALAQNLISNPGFENYSSLPTGVAQYNLAVGWNNCNGGGSPDYFHTFGGGQVQLPNCFIGTVNANAGDGCMGAALYYNSPPDFREYLSSQLITPLVIGNTYTVNFHITNGVTAGFYGGGGIDKISAAFTMQPLTQPGMGPIPITPQVTNGTVFYDHNWQLISMQFVADSAYEYITIGNFYPDAQTTYQQFDQCSSYGAYYFFDDLEVVQTNVVPVALFSAPNHICPGTCTDFNNLSQNATSYLWSFPGATPSTSIDSNPVGICYNTPGNYTVELIASNAVTSDTLTLTNYITVYPYPAPQGINQSGDTLYANPGAVSYQWYQDGNSIPGATDYFYVATQSGNYNVVATDVNDCEVEAAIFDVIAGIPFEVLGLKFEVYPNPVKDKFTVHNARFTMETAEEISIYNALGQKVALRIPDLNYTVDCSGLSAGYYYVEVIVDQKVCHLKFLKN